MQKKHLEYQRLPVQRIRLPVASGDPGSAGTGCPAGVTALPLPRPSRSARTKAADRRYDPNYRASLWRNEQTAVQEMKAVIPFADVMKVSDEESLLLTGKNSYEEAAEELLSMGPELIAITLGSDGVLVATTDGKEQIRGFATEAVDTTGAGDSFWGGFLSQFLSLNKAIDEMDWNDLRACARQGNAVACLCVQKRGGIPAIPKKREVMEFLNQHIKK